MTAQRARYGVGECDSLSMEEVVVVGKQTVRQAARLAASQVQGKYRRERVERDRRLERLAVEVLTALGERGAMIAAAEQRAGAALQAMIIDEHLTVSEAVRTSFSLENLGSGFPHEIVRCSRWLEGCSNA